MVSQVTNKTNKQSKATKAAAASTKAKGLRQSQRLNNLNNITDVLQGINKPNATRAEVVLQPLGRTSNSTPNHNNNHTNPPAEVSPESNDADKAPAAEDTDQPNTNPPPPESNDEDDDVMEVEVEVTATTTTATSDATQPPPPAKDNNNSNQPTNQPSPSSTNNNNSTQPPKQSNPPATPAARKSNLRADTPRFTVPPSFAEQTRASMEEVVAEQEAQKRKSAKQHTVVGPHNEQIRVEHDEENLVLKEYVSDDLEDSFSRDFHVNGFLHGNPVYPVASFSFSTNGSTSAENMNQFTKGINGWLTELLIVDPNLAFVPLNISDTAPANQWKKPSDVPKNFTRLGKVIFIQGGSWCFDPKQDKPTNDIYASVRIKSTVPLEELLQAVGFEWKRIGGGDLRPKKHQSIWTETPYMLLFVYNKTEEESIIRDLQAMFKIARDVLREEDLLPSEYERPEGEEVSFAIRVNGPRIPGMRRDNKKKKKDNDFDRLQDQGKKAFHFEVAKEDIKEFSFIAEQCHRMGLDKEFFGKFAKLTACLTNNSPSSDSSLLRRCINGHLSYHMSVTSVCIDGIEDINAIAVLTNPHNNAVIASKSVRDMLYRIKLQGGGPLFLQVYQRSNGDVEAVIPNTAEAETKGEMIKRNVAAFCTFLWTDEGLPEAFVKKLVERGMNARRIHDICKCTWDKKNQVLTTPDDRSDADAIREFENQDWVKDLVQVTNSNTTHSTKKQHVDPNAAFPFQDDFSVGTIHANKAATPRSETLTTHAADGTPILHLGRKEVIDVDAEQEESSVASTQTTKGTEAHPTNARKCDDNTAVDESNDGSSGSSDEGYEDEPVSGQG